MLLTCLKLNLNGCDSITSLTHPVPRGPDLPWTLVPWCSGSKNLMGISRCFVRLPNIDGSLLPEARKACLARSLSDRHRSRNVTLSSSCRCVRFVRLYRGRNSVVFIRFIREALAVRLVHVFTLLELRGEISRINAGASSVVDQSNYQS